MCLDNVEHLNNSSSGTSWVGSVSNGLAFSGGEEPPFSPGGETGLEHSFDVLVLSDFARSKKSSALKSEINHGVRSNSVSPRTNDSSLFLWDSGNLLRTARESGNSKRGVLFGTGCSGGNGDSGRGWKSAKVESLHGDSVDSGGF